MANPDNNDVNVGDAVMGIVGNSVTLVSQNPSGLMAQGMASFMTRQGIEVSAPAVNPNVAAFNRATAAQPVSQVKPAPAPTLALSGPNGMR